MKKLVAISVMLLSACAAAGGLRPTIFTDPTSYLESFPIGTVTEAEMFTKIGPPDRTIEVTGKKAFVYQLGKGYGIRTFTYTFEGGVVADVIYNDSGPYNGSTAKAIQGAKVTQGR